MAEKGKEKVTWMKLSTAPLDSEKNFSRVKKAICSIPQIRDVSFDEKNNAVTIKVVCCSPEKVMEKLCSKGRGAIKRIETINPPNIQAEKPKAPEKPKEAEKPKELEKPKQEVGQSSQSMTVMQAPMMNDPYYYQPQPNYGYPQRPVYDSYGGGGPLQPNHPYYGQSAFDYNQFSHENTQGCSIM